MENRKKRRKIKQKDLQLAEEELENSKEKIFIKWGETWENQIIENGGNITLPMKEGQELFKNLFETNYKYIKSKAK